MQFDTIRQILSYAADNLGLQILETGRFGRDVNRALDLTGKWQKRDCPLKAPIMMWFVMALMFYRSLSIPNVLKKLIHQYRLEFPRLSLNAITPEATCHARARLGVEPMRVFFETQAARIKSVNNFHHLRVFAVDGTTANVPDTPANEAYFGRPKAPCGDTAFPQMTAVCLTETSTRRIRGVVFAPCYTPEREGVLSMLPCLKKNDLLLMDRGISAAWMFNECQNRSLHFLGRIESSWKVEMRERLGDGDSLVTLSRKKGLKLDVRMIEYRYGENEFVRLLTDLVDTKEYPAMELAKLYHSRWECEIAYDELKTHLGQVAGGALDLLFRSKSPDGVLQEAYALFGLYNMIRELMAKAGELHDVDPLEISFVETVQVIKETTPRFQAATTTGQSRQILLQMLKDIAECRNRRPRRNRKWERVIKSKTISFKRKHKGCCEKRLDLEKELRLAG